MPRRANPSTTFGSKFEVALQELSTQFLKSAAFKHAATLGTEREIPVQECLRQHLPATFRVGKGEAVDVYDEHSPQLDVVVYDALRNYAFVDGDSLLLPAEALLVSIEVKSLLNRAEMATSLRAAAKLRRLRPFRVWQPKAPNNDGAPRDYPCRYFHCIFAYGTDLGEADWAKREFARMTEVANEEGLAPGVIDRVYVARRGLLNITSSAGISEQGNAGIGLLHFYMHILNFLARENNSRDAVPYLQYAGRLTKGWKKL